MPVCLPDNTKIIIIITSGYCEDVIVPRDKETGRVGFIQKPCKLSSLERVIINLEDGL